MHRRRAIIFDLDDTLVDTQSGWRHAERRLLRLLNISDDDAILEELNGRSARDVVHLIHGRFPSGVSLKFSEEFFYAELTSAVVSNLTIKCGAMEALQRVANGVPMAIASGSPTTLIHTVLAQLKLSKFFACVTSSDDVAEGKPSPAVLLATSRKLTIPPERCVVIEDSLVGVQAARAAGMACIAIPSRVVETPRIGKLAHVTLTSLEELHATMVSEALALARN